VLIVKIATLRCTLLYLSPFAMMPLGFLRSALMPRQRPRFSSDFFSQGQGLPQGSAGDVGCASLLPRTYSCRRNYLSLRLTIVTLVSLPDERRWFGVAIGHDTSTTAQTVYTMLETTRYLQTQSANEGAVCLFTEPPSTPN
jgi:hypothetical protein